ncbi:cobalt-precorrin 5A hydrolase [Listeria cossartiae subsp. cayugensis]|uniref:Cobalt-precorrin 5A hydrolase n=1 Tax=Listeria cossartiae subsp. cayugensis TaxID=2713505 RepID=A0ABU2ILQ0_9LIST|nr:cobalt-precorrin 5A hydrolase [Listeria cossartiae]MDT0048611.1 cobalt-precorrin 5A hydrolase [Listeria cossartiae subsp. cayugensis]MDT0065114.1 cobalt-precorrin 5A hydrolase [Listeria cossartiae subsp. cayugensis]MDT0079282.1 cobalt-precorrin 5A hydrolase [Listeria cossartiae subsp. cayugensis]MDT0082118.1 cobalt-precorrin 5A hydrolase [Listeria cossartiae subsp. cayugensis]MDT0087347.1 cobalt-precorrin 5A hydrolase [Listeria cossartiae subsp. cayugensis]
MSTDKIAIIAVTERGRDLAINLTETVSATIFVPEKHQNENTHALLPNFGTAMREIFTDYQALICIMATGIVVRTLAPVIEDKLSDPAVIVMDEHGQFIISLLSGHVGGANQLTEEIATITGGVAVITTATDRANVAAIDNIAKQLDGYLPDFKATTKRINGLLAAGKKVSLCVDEPFEVDTRGFTNKEVSPQIFISTKNNLPTTKIERIQLVPRQFILGVGCRKDISAETIDAAFTHFCEQENIHPRAFRAIHSITLKAEEPAILHLAEQWGIEFIVHSAEELQTVAGKYPTSAFVQKTVQVGNVALSSADIGSNGNVITSRFAENGVTFAAGKLIKNSEVAK